MTKLPTITGEKWFNIEPPVVTAGKAVLVSFWNYTNARCLRIVPLLRKWWEKYRDYGFFPISVHVPTFSFEGTAGNLRRAIAELNIGWPVLMDERGENWRLFPGAGRPAGYFFDSKGNLIHTQVGEEGYAAAERVIQGLVATVTPNRKLPPAENARPAGRKRGGRTTSDLFCGFDRGAIVNPEGQRLGEEYDYPAPRSVPSDSIGLEGGWYTAEEYIAGLSPAAKLMLCFNARAVNLVAAAEKEPLELDLRLDSRPLRPGLRGTDVAEASRVAIGRPRVYNLVKSRVPVSGLLELKGGGRKWRAYNFSFTAD